MMKRYLLPSFLLLTAGLALGQQARQREYPLQRMIKSLDLTDGQVQQLKDLLEKRRTEVAPLREQLRQEAGALRELLKGTDPNPAQVGQAAIKVHELRAQLAASQEAFLESFEGILTAEQKAKLKTVQQRRRSARMTGAFRRLPL